MPDLESLSLHRYDAVPFSLLRRCSAQRSLSISYWRLDSITIDLPLLEELVLSATAQLRRVVIKAPRLKKLTFGAIEGVLDDFSLHHMAPEVEDLSWECASYFSRVRFGDIWSVRIVTIKTSEPQGQLPHSPPSNALSLNICEWLLMSLLSGLISLL